MKTYRIVAYKMLHMTLGNTRISKKQRLNQLCSTRNIKHVAGLIRDAEWVIESISERR